MLTIIRTIMRKLFYVTGVAAVLMLATFCKKVNPNEDSGLISTGAPENVTASGATLKGVISFTETVFSDAGFIYDKAGSLKKDSSPRVEGVMDDHVFTADLKDLSHGTKYEYMARAVVNGKEVFGKIQSFTTATVSVASIKITPASLELFLGRDASAQLTATVSPADATNPALTWSSSAPQVATVSENGLVKPVAEGSAVITAQSADGKVKAECPVRVKVVTVTDILLNFTYATIRTYQDKTLLLIATVEPADAVDKTLTWTSENPSVATVSSTGLVTAVSNGSTNISVKCGSVIRKCGVKVYTPSEAVDLGLSVKWAAANLHANSPEQKGAYGSWGWTDVDGSNGYGGSETTLPMNYDAARVNLGGTWRIPTAQDMQELNSQCTWTWETNGYRITGKNGNSIFLPITGGYLSGAQWMNPDDGYYWASTRINSSTTYPHLLRIGKNGVHQVYSSTQSFIHTQNKAFFRPVCSK